ncbi:MAG: hypothetical protein R3F34_06890 [Planctomycetota bacterium]
MSLPPRTPERPGDPCAGRAEYFVLVLRDSPLVERRRDRVCALAGATMGDACLLLAERPHADPATTVEKRTGEGLAEWLREHEVDTLVVVAGSAREDVALDAPPEADVPDAGDACPLVMIVDAGARPERDDESNRALLRMRRDQIAKGHVSPLMLDTWISSDHDLYVPCHHEMLEREMWPKFEVRETVSGQRSATFSFYTTVEDAARAAGVGGRVVAMGGLDAVRWAFAAPVDLDEIVIDAGTPDAVCLGRHRVIAMLFPATLPFADTRSVPRIELGELTAYVPMPPDSALVLGSMLSGWKSMLGPTSDPISDGPIHAFTCNTTYVEAMGRAELQFSTGVGATEHPPFHDWLGHVRERGRLIVDPTRTAPITLDVRRLFLLAQWAEHGTTIEAERFVDDLANDSRTEHVLPEHVPAILAEWPHWAVGEGRAHFQPDASVDLDEGRATRPLLERVAPRTLRRTRTRAGSTASPLARAELHPVRGARPVRGRHARVPGLCDRSAEGRDRTGSRGSARRRRSRHGAGVAEPPTCPPSRRLIAARRAWLFVTLGPGTALQVNAPCTSSRRTPSIRRAVTTTGTMRAVAPTSAFVALRPCRGRAACRARRRAPRR